MRKFLLFLALSVFGLHISAAPARAIMVATPQGAYLSCGYYPWDQSADAAAMNQVFGPETVGWDRLYFNGGDALFQSGSFYQFIWMDGGDGCTDEFVTFINAHGPQMEAWVANGGRLFLNVGDWWNPNIAFGFGGITYVTGNGPTAVPADPGHEIFHEPFGETGTVFNGSSIFHGRVQGPGIDPLLFGQGSTDIVYGEKPWGAGVVFPGGLTSSYFHSPKPQTDYLRWNMLYYMAFGGTRFLSVAPASGNEDTPIPLSITAFGTTVTLNSVTISNLPAGASLNHGTQTAPGVWTLTPADLVGLFFNPPANSNVDVSLTVVGHGTLIEDSSPATQTSQLFIDLIGVADDPMISSGMIFPAGRPNVPVVINVTLGDTDSSESYQVEINNVPEDSVLSAGVKVGPNTWVLQPNDLPGLKITIPARLKYYIQWMLPVTITVTENDGDSRVVFDQVVYLDLSLLNDDAAGDLPVGVNQVVQTSGGGCTVGNGADLLLPLLLFGAVGFLMRRKRA